MMRDMKREPPPAEAELLADQRPARPDDPSLRAATRRLRAAGGRLLGVLDDDPTGSQAMHDVQVVTVLDEDAYAGAFDAAAGEVSPACFVLTNSRSLPADEAAAVTADAARGLLAVATRRGSAIDLISRSDSTLRGHVIGEVEALAGALRQTGHAGPDAVLFVPAFIEAGRVTVGDVHWARTDIGMVPVGETEFARDRVFGYTASDLRQFLAAASGCVLRPDAVASISLEDIRVGGVSQVRELLAGVRDATWVVVNAAAYSDLETVAHAVLLAERSGQSFLFRTGPSFVRALSGLDPRAPLRGQDLAPAHGGGAGGNRGLIVVGSHVEQTNRQLGALLAMRTLTQVTLDAGAVAGGATDVVTAAAERVVRALRDSDVLLCTSREVVSGTSRQGGDLAVARAVSAALAATVRLALPGEPAWIIAKGGITSHDVAVHGLGIRRAEVAGQLFPGLISVFRGIDAAPEAVGMPYVVFPGNVGDATALVKVVELMHGAEADR